MRIKIVLIGLCYLLVSSYSYGTDEIYTKFFSNKAVGGYDALSYFQDGGPKKGKSSFAYTYKNATWYFVNAANKALFEENPTRYAPQYGGHCAWAVSEKDSLVSADPLEWTIVEDKLYLNYDESVKNLWLEDTSGFIEKANKHWPGLIK